MTGRTSPRIKPVVWATAWSLCQFGSAVGELTTSLLPRQTGPPQSAGWGGQGRPPFASLLTCSGHVDYNGCLPWLGGGCCSKGLECQSGSVCVAGATTSTTATVVCDQGWSPCPSSQGGGCCLSGQICGSGVCTAQMPLTTTITGTGVSTVTSEVVSNQISPNLTSIVSTTIAATVPQLSRNLSFTDASGDSSADGQAGATSAGSSPTGSQTGASSAGDALTAGQIGGISAGAVVGFLLLAALGWLLVRHMIRISRFMDKFDNHPQDRPEQPATEGEEDGTKESELNILNDGNTGGEQPVAELSPQERPQLLEEWGRHGSRGNELTGSQEAHGISELDGTGVHR
ncbi:hypothetical protein FJTKL_08666 [Diaporthe vaccinii]|uniref:Uncharacterized protein n=1 Tax=Diaporthe vaccinii TaxID=105482 RepID=A0ABR4EQX0_9PEZI